MKFNASICAGLVATLLSVATPALSQTIKIGFISSYSGAAAAQGDIVVAYSLEAGARSAGALVDIEIANFYRKP